jgi:hypothetical protein
MHDGSGGICVKGSKQELLSGVADYMRHLQRMLAQQQHHQQHQHQQMLPQMQTQRQTSGTASCEAQVQVHEHDRLPPPPCPPAVKAVKYSSPSSLKQPSAGVTAPVITVDSAYREVFLQSAVALAVADASGRFIEVSARFEGMLVQSYCTLPCSAPITTYHDDVSCYRTYYLLVLLRMLCTVCMELKAKQR